MVIDEDPDEQPANNSNSATTLYHQNVETQNSGTSLDLKCRERVTDSDVEDAGHDFRKNLVNSHTNEKVINKYIE